MSEQQALSGRTVIVTGAANGMGRVMIRALAAAGARAAAVDLDAAGLDRLADEPVFAGRLRKIAADVSKAEDCRDAVADALAAFGSLDILVNCAGISMAHAAAHKQARIKFFDADADGWRRIIMINCVGAFLMARFAAPAMIARGWGRIINVTTSFDTMLAAGLSAYGASKAALEASCVAWSKDLEGTGVSVNILVPGGPTDTPEFFLPDIRARLRCSIPRSWQHRSYGWRRRNPTASAQAASSPATGTRNSRRPRPPHACACLPRGLPWRRTPLRPAAMRCDTKSIAFTGRARRRPPAQARQTG